MTPGQFLESIAEVKAILDVANLFSDRNYYPTYSSFSPSNVRDLSYKQLWEYLTARQFFDYRLTDGSLLQFEEEGTPKGHKPAESCYSYRYVQCPFACTTYSAFLEGLGFDYEECGSAFEADYQLYLQGQPARETAVPARYDYAPHAYHPGYHPAAHIHIGHETDIRIRTQKLLSPVSFALFVVRQYYPGEWQRLLSLPLKPRWKHSIRKNLADVHSRYLGALDNHELVLS